MTNEEKIKIVEEARLLKILLDFHLQNRNQVGMSDNEFEIYVDAVLDRLNELNELLNENDH